MTEMLRLPSAPVHYEMLRLPSAPVHYEMLSLSSGPVHYEMLRLPSGPVHYEMLRLPSAAVHYEFLLPRQASTQGFLETPTLKALAPTGSNLGQACCYQECSPHTLLPQCGLRHRPLLRSRCNQRNSSGQRQRGTLVSMSARCLNQISRSSSLRPSRRNLAPCNPVTLPQKSGKLCVALCTALLCLPLGRGPQNHMTGSKPNLL